jgi:hypothetical protein
VAERQHAGVAPDQVQRQGDDGVAQDLADQRQGVGRHVQALSAGTATATAAPAAQDDRADGKRDFRAGLLRGGDSRAGSSVDHPSFQCEEALRTFLDEQNDQREDEDLAEHGTDLRFENLVGDAQAERRQTLPASCPTPPSTTTRNESMM